MLRFLSKFILEFIRGFFLEIYRPFFLEFLRNFSQDPIQVSFRVCFQISFRAFFFVFMCVPGILPEFLSGFEQVFHGVSTGVPLGISSWDFPEYFQSRHLTGFLSGIPVFLVEFFTEFHFEVSRAASEISLIFRPGIIPRILSQGVPVVLMISSKIYLEISLVVLPGSSCWVSPGFHPLFLREFLKRSFEDYRARSHSAENSWEKIQ